MEEPIGPSYQEMVSDTEADPLLDRAKGWLRKLSWEHQQGEGAPTVEARPRQEDQQDGRTLRVAARTGGGRQDYQQGGGQGWRRHHTEFGLVTRMNLGYYMHDLHMCPWKAGFCEAVCAIYLEIASRDTHMVASCRLCGKENDGESQGDHAEGRKD